MFAGPNGSGKSTLKSYLPEDLLGVYLNPDEIEARLHSQGALDFKEYGISTTADELLSFIRNSTLLSASGISQSTIDQGCHSEHEQSLYLRQLGR